MTEPNNAASVARPEPAPISEPDAETRSCQVLVRLTPSEFAELQRAADRLHTSRAELLRSTWFFMKDADDNARRTA